MKRFFIILACVAIIGCTKEEIRATVSTGVVVYSVGYELNRQEYCALSENERTEYRADQGLSESHYMCEE